MKQILFKHICRLLSLLILIPLYSSLTLPVLADTITLYPTDIASGKDNGPKDGIFDEFYNPGFPSLYDNGFSEGRICVEFDLSAIRAPVLQATLKCNAKQSNDAALITIYGYSGNGQIELSDFANTGNALGTMTGIPELNSLAVTGFISSLPDNSYAGFNFDEALRTPSPLTNCFGDFKLEVKTGTLTVAPTILLLDQ